VFVLPLEIVQKGIASSL